MSICFSKIFAIFRPFALLVVLSTVTLAVIRAEIIRFNFKDPKGVNALTFLVDSRLEPITGWSKGIYGEINFDISKPENTYGTISIQTDSLSVANPLMTEHMHSERWLNKTKYPTIEFQIKKVQNLKSDVNGEDVQYTADVTGILSLHGEQKEITVPVRATYMKDQLAKRVRDMAGDLLVVRTIFYINRSDFKIGDGIVADTIGDSIEIRIAVAGIAPKDGKSTD